MKRPFIFITIPLIIGIIFSYYFNFNIFVIFSFIIFLLAYYFLNLIKDKSNNINMFFIFMFLGMILIRINLNMSTLSLKIGDNLILKGVVEEIKYEKDGESKYIIDVLNLIDDKKNVKVNEKLVLKIIGDRKVELGDKIIFNGRLKEPLSNGNPNLFNYKLSLLSNKIFTTMTIKDYSLLEVNGENKELKYRMKIKFKEDIERIFNIHLNEANSSLMKSIVLGEYSYLDEDSISKYRDLGLAHILAVSGLHIGIIAGFLLFILSNLGIKRKKVVLITLTIIWLYGFLIGFPPSLLRANIMFSILYYAQILSEPYDSINGLFFAMFILLIINPMWIFNLGFQLSFLATFSIIYFTPKVYKIFYPYKNKFTYTLSALLGVYIGVLPVQAYYFNKVSLLGILGNLIIAPILSVSLIVAGSMVLFSYLVSPLNIILGVFLNLLLKIQFKFIEILSSTSFGTIKLYSPNIGEMILYYILILIIIGVLEIRLFKRNMKSTIFSYLIFFVASSFMITALDKTIEIHFIDVGQGDAALLRTYKGDYLIDTGGNLMESFDVGKNLTLPYLEKLGIKRLNGVFITHFHEDHSKSLPLLIDNLKIDRVFASYEDYNNLAFNKIKDAKMPLIILTEKDKINLGKNLNLEILSPNLDLMNIKASANDLSLVFLLTYFDKRVLFTGDMEKDAEKLLLDKIHNKIDVIKVPHHGSDTSSTEELLHEIKPDIGVISVGRNNFYGHPKKEVLERYDEIQTQLYRTDIMGMTKIVLARNSIEVDYFIKEKSKLSSFIYKNLVQIIYYIVYYLISYILTKVYIYTEEELRFSEL